MAEERNFRRKKLANFSRADGDPRFNPFIIVTLVGPNLGPIL
jgi:hypothetical protein